VVEQEVMSSKQMAAAILNTPHFLFIGPPPFYSQPTIMISTLAGQVNPWVCGNRSALFDEVYGLGGCCTIFVQM